MQEVYLFCPFNLYFTDSKCFTIVFVFCGRSDLTIHVGLYFWDFTGFCQPRFWIAKWQGNRRYTV